MNFINFGFVSDLDQPKLSDSAKYQLLHSGWFLDVILAVYGASLDIKKTKTVLCSCMELHNKLV
jgi:hypothetical protein